MEGPYDNSMYNNGGAPADSYPLQGIKFPGMNDVMCGRGGATNNHIGNIRFRQLVNEHKRRYLAASKVDKPRVALEVVKIWRGLDPPGRFLTKTHTALGDTSPWHDVGDKKAREKASQCLRERTPDVIPFVKQLEQQQQQERENKKKDPKEKASSLRQEEVPTKLPVGQAEPESVAASAPLDPQVNSSSSTENPKRRSKTRHEFANSIPTGAALTKVVFSDDGDEIGANETDEAQAFMEDYQQVLQDLAESAVSDNNSPDAAPSSGGERPPLSKTQSGYSWMKSFKSIDSNFSNMEASAYSMRESVDEEDSDEEEEEEGEQTEDQTQEADSDGGYADIPEDAPQAQPVKSATTRPTLSDFSRNRPRMVNAAYARDSQMSIMSDLSSRSLMMGNSADQASKRSLMMGNAADQASKRSVLSVMSDMTELSDALKDMDLSTVGGTQR